MERKGRCLADASGGCGGGRAATEMLIVYEAVVRALHGVDREREEEVLVLGLRDS
jgi:hypothetical protein